MCQKNYVSQKADIVICSKSKEKIEIQIALNSGHKKKLIYRTKPLFCNLPYLLNLRPQHYPTCT